jgi:hypothetical protein
MTSRRLAGTAQSSLEQLMNIHLFDVPDLKLIVPKRCSDPRGFFSEIWSDRQFREEIADVAFVQDNQSVSARKGTPSSASFSAIPRPMPRELPVISAYFPLSDMEDLLIDYLVISQIVPIPFSNC